MPNKVEPDLNDLATYCVKHNLFNIYAQYDRKKNSIPINQVASKSGKKVWWCCPKGHSYQATPADRMYHHSGCPYCSNKKLLVGFNDLKTLFPKVANEFDVIKNESNPENFIAGSHKKVWRKCSKCGASYLAEIKSRTYGNRGCSVCAGRSLRQGINDLETWCKTHNRNDILSSWDYHKNTKKPSEVLVGGDNYFWFICPKCHKSYRQRLLNKRYLNAGCPFCSIQKSCTELSILEMIKKYIDPQVESGKKFFKKEIDIYAPKINLYLEYDGIHYHNNDGQLKKQEIEKNNIFAQNKITLTRIKETNDKSKNLLKESSEFLDIYYIYKNYNKQFWESLSEILKQICEIKISPEEIKNTYLSIKQRKNS